MPTIPYWQILVIGTQLRSSKSLLFQINHVSLFSVLPHYKILILGFPLHLLHSSFPAKPVTAVPIQLTFSSQDLYSVTLCCFYHHWDGWYTKPGTFLELTVPSAWNHKPHHRSDASHLCPGLRTWLLIFIKRRHRCSSLPRSEPREWREHSLNTDVAGTKIAASQNH